jgi:hypothetical protein
VNKGITEEKNAQKLQRFRNEQNEKLSEISHPETSTWTEANSIYITASCVVLK